MISINCEVRQLPRVFVSLLIVLPMYSADAQQTSVAAQPVVGQVTGQVLCQDNGLPARFATVQLLPEKPQHSPLVDSAKMGGNSDIAKVMAKAMAAAMKGSNLSTVTGMDGSFLFGNVPAGTYYLIAQLPGYRSPLSGLSNAERMRADADTLAAVETAADKIVVAGGASISVNVSLEPGATLSGKVGYDDGSPAPSVTPTLLMLQKDGKWKELLVSTLPVVTDDRGYFRFFGLPAGKYAVKATLPVSQPVAGLGTMSAHINLGDALVVYQGGALWEKDIKAVELGDGEHRDGVEVIFPVNGLHSISGIVVAKFDKHAVNAGTVQLKDPDTKAPVRTATIADDGTFKLSYVPERAYLLEVTAAADAEQKSGDGPATFDFGRMTTLKIIRSYGSAEMPLLVSGDVNGITIEVPNEKQ